MGRIGSPPSFDVLPPYAGTTGTVYPGAIATGDYTGAADPAAEERFNLWMDGFLSMSQSRQLGLMYSLDAKEKAGTLTADEKKQLVFARNILGVTKVPELSEADLARVKAGKAEEIALNVVGERKSALPMFLAMAGIGAVALIATGKKGR
jgi:hypothetical protein